MFDQHKTIIRSLALAACLVGCAVFAFLWAQQIPSAAAARPALQATATAAPAVVSRINACGVEITNEVITPSADVTSTVVAQAPTAVSSPTAAATASTGPAPTAQVLRIGEDIYPAVLDPQRSSFVNEFEILTLAYEGLVTVDTQGSVEPAAAESFEFNPEGTQLTFTLRPDLKRVDGTLITSQDFADAIKRALDPCLGGRQYAAVLFDIQGAQEASEFEIDNKTEAELLEAMERVGIKTPDDRTLIFQFTEPVGPHWIYSVSLPVFFPTDAEIASTLPDGWSEIPGNHNGNGPFVILNLDEGNSITLVANPNYRLGKPELDRIEFKYNGDSQALLDAYKRGELEIDAAVTADLVPQIMSDTIASELQQYESAQTYALAFNNTIEPFNDRIVRTAFSQAVDRAGFVRDVLMGTGSPTTRWLPAGVPGNQADQPGVPGTDAAAAIKTLVDNGYGTTDGKVDCTKLGAIKLTYPDTPANKIQVDYVTANLKSVFGCDIAIEAVNPTQFTLLVRNVQTNPQMSFQRWVEDYPHPQNWLSTYWTCGSFARRYGYCNVFLDKLLKQADATTDFESAVQLYQQAEDLLITDVPGAFMYNPYNLQLIKPYVQGPGDNMSPRDAGWIGQWGPVRGYGVDLTAVPENYPKE